MAKRAILRWSPELLMMMGSGKFEVIERPLPDDAKFISAQFDQERGGSINLLIESKEFKDIASGELWPLLEGPIIRRIDQ